MSGRVLCAPIANSTCTVCVVCPVHVSGSPVTYMWFVLCLPCQVREASPTLDTNLAVTLMRTFSGLTPHFTVSVHLIA